MEFQGGLGGGLGGRLGGGLGGTGQVRSRSGLAKVWFSLRPKFNSFELDSEVGQLVYLVSHWLTFFILQNVQ